MSSFLHRKYYKFLFAGLPSFLIAIPLNFFLVEVVQINYSLAYIVVLVLQVTINFFAVTYFVFKDHNSTPLVVKFYKFFSAIMFVRFVDWLVYTLLVVYFGLYYLLIQVLNVIFFSFFKYKFSKKVIEG